MEEESDSSDLIDHMLLTKAGTTNDTEATVVRVPDVPEDQPMKEVADKFCNNSLLRNENIRISYLSMCISSEPLVWERKFIIIIYKVCH